MSSLNASCSSLFPSSRTLAGLLFSHFHGLRWRVVLGAAPFPPNHLDAYDKYSLPPHSPLFHLLLSANRSSISAPTANANASANAHVNTAPTSATATPTPTLSSSSPAHGQTQTHAHGHGHSALPSSASSGMFPSLGSSCESMSYWSVVRQICQGQRQKYAQLRQKHILTEQRLTELSSSPNSFGSLSSRNRVSTADLLSSDFSERVQQQWNSSSALLDAIRADLYKSYQGHDFFTQLITQKMMERILQIWALENTAISYQPAMNELLAVLIVALKKDYDLQIPEEAPAELQAIINSQFLEHDAYTLFSHLMTRMTLYFQKERDDEMSIASLHSPFLHPMPASPPVISVQNHSTNAHNPHHGSLHRKSPSMSAMVTAAHTRTASGQVFHAVAGSSLNGALLSSSAMSSGFASALSISAGGSAVPVSNNPLILLYSASSSLAGKLDRIHSFLLRETDPNLFAILEALHIFPSLYLHKWIRFLFVKVFPATHQIISVWDYLFTRSPIIHSNSYASFGPSFDTLIDFFCVAMLEAVRFDIFSAVKGCEDDNLKCKESVLKILSEYPPIEDVHALFKLADNIRRGLEAIFSARNSSTRTSSGGLASASNSSNVHHFDEREEDQKMDMKQPQTQSITVASALLALPKSSATKKRTSFFSFDSSASIDFKGIFSSYFSNMPDSQQPINHTQSANTIAAAAAAPVNSAANSNHANNESHALQHQHPSSVPTPPPLTPHLTMNMTAPTSSPTSGSRSLSTHSKSGFPSVQCSFSDECGEYVFKTSGFLIKRGGGKRALGRKSYKVRWFVLANGVLTYYDSARATEALKEGIELKHKLIRMQDEDRNHFLIVHDPNAPRGSATTTATGPTDASLAISNALASAAANADTPTATAASLSFTFERANSRDRGSEGNSLSELKTFKKENERVYELYAEDRAAMVQWIGALLNVSNPD